MPSLSPGAPCGPHSTPNQIIPFPHAGVREAKLRERNARRQEIIEYKKARDALREERRAEKEERRRQRKAEKEERVARRGALLQEKQEEDEAKRLQEAERHAMLNKPVSLKKSVKHNQGSFTQAGKGF